eukprot:scaffold126065_cov63-Phaeocystis_antarctica.AAC.4
MLLCVTLSSLSPWTTEPARGGRAEQLDSPSVTSARGAPARHWRLWSGRPNACRRCRASQRSVRA